MARHREISIEESFVPINREVSRRRIEEVAAKHDIQGRASTVGQKNEPRSEDTHLDENQRALIDESQGFVAAVTRRAGAEITERVNHIRTVMPATLDTALEQANIRRHVAEARDRYRDDLDLAHADRQRKLRDLRTFEEDNGLAPHSAIYSNDKAMFFAALLVLVLGEAVFNAFLFEELQERGLVGGLILAVTVGVANILMGAGTGFLGWRLMAHVRRSHRALGIVVTVLLMTGALALHLALGDLRESITRDVNAHIDFLVILKPSRYFAYTSIPPFVLFAVGVAMFVIAALKGRGATWGSVAPYWHHDVMDRRFRAADRTFEDAKENLKNALANAFDGEREKLRARHATDMAHVCEIRRLAAEAYGIERTLSDSILDEVGRLHIWLRMYRDRNRAVRTTPAPDYFETYPAFEEWRTTRLDVSELKQLAAAAEQVIAENAAKLASLEDKTLQEQTAAIEAMLTVVSASERRAATQVAKDDAVATARAS